MKDDPRCSVPLSKPAFWGARSSDLKRHVKVLAKTWFEARVLARMALGENEVFVPAINDQFFDE